jgi:hypothetical protein
MKRQILYVASLLVVAASVFLGSCKKGVIDRTTQYPALAPANIDLNADTWSPVLAKDPSVFNVPAPDATNSAAYAADINEIKSYQGKLTDDQKAIVKYFTRPGCQA